MEHTILPEDPIPKHEVLFTFEQDHAEIYMGAKTIKVDTDTALYMLRQRETMPEGRAWENDFPSVVNHTSSSNARHHPDFQAAKHGDFDAALRLIDDLVKDERVISVAQQHPSATIAYVHRQQGDGINMRPAAYAAKFSALGMNVEHNIYAITNVSHTDATDMERISRRMRFEGEVSRGMNYIILDDFITSGAELRDMKDYINSKGGNVVMMTTLGHGGYGKLSDIRIDNAYTTKLQRSGITDTDLRKYGIASHISCLTLSEAAKLSRVVNAGRKTEVAQVPNGLRLIHSRARGLSEMEGEVRSSRLQSVQIEVTQPRPFYHR